MNTRFASMTGQILLRRRLRLLAEKEALYRDVADPEKIYAYQLDRLNKAWQFATSRYTFYRAWQQKHGLPERIKSLKDLEKFPILQKSDLQENRENIFRDAGDCGSLNSGGSTGQPTAVPCTDRDRDVIWANLYLGRSWWGITPSTPKIQIWGHAYSMNENPSARIMASAKRGFKDALINTKRLSAYHLSFDTSAAYFEKLRRNQGAVVISYAAAFRTILDWIEATGADGRSAKIDKVILTSERIDPSDVTRAKELLGATVISEYGLSETGCIAYACKNSFDHRVIWDSVIASIGSSGNLMVTTIAGNLFPLMRYDTGDLLENWQENHPHSILRMGRVVGRANDLIDIPLQDERIEQAHSEVLTHVIRQEKNIHSFLIRQKGRHIEVQILADSKDRLPAFRQVFLERLRRIYPMIDETCISVSWLEREEKTPAGKHRWIVKE